LGFNEATNLYFNQLATAITSGGAGSIMGMCTQPEADDTVNQYGVTEFAGALFVNAFAKDVDPLGFAKAGQCGELTTNAQYATSYTQSKGSAVAPPATWTPVNNMGYAVTVPASTKTATCTKFTPTITVENVVIPFQAPKVQTCSGEGTSKVCTISTQPPVGYFVVTCNFPKSSSVCFPATAAVQLEDGSAVRMDALQVGQKVRVGAKEHSEVFMFSHTYTDAQATFVQLKTATGSIQLTEGHYIYANGKAVPAGTVKVGDLLETATGAPSAVTGISTVRATGLYNPHTLNGDIVVNGFRTTTYTDAINPTLAHAMLAPARAMYAMNITLA